MCTSTVATLNFATCAIRRCVNVNIADFGTEPDEDIVFTLMRTSGLDSRITIRTESTGNDGKSWYKLSV